MEIDEDRPSVRRICLGVDASGYSAADDHRQVDLQKAIERVVTGAASAASLDRPAWAIQRRGDGELSVLPDTASEADVVDALVRHIVSLLERFNADRRSDARLRLRVAVHFGRLILTPTGFAGPTPVETVRLLDSAAARQALVDNPTSDLVLIVSERVFADTVAPRHTTISPRLFTKVRVTEKGFQGDAWIWLAPPDDRVAARSAARAADPGTVQQPEPTLSYQFTGDVHNTGTTIFGPVRGDVS